MKTFLANDLGLEKLIFWSLYLFYNHWAGLYQRLKNITDCFVMSFEAIYLRKFFKEIWL